MLDNRKIAFFCLIVVLSLSACSPQAAIQPLALIINTPEPSVEAPTPAVTRPVEIEHPGPTQTTGSSPDASPHPLVRQPSAEPTDAPVRISTSTPVPTFGPRRLTPPTLMLHESTPEFDAVTFLNEFIAILKSQDFEVITYQQITANPDITALKQGRLFIITIDDIALQSEIDASVQEMIALLREAGYPAVLGVVTEGLAANENTVSTLKELAGLGWEIAAHTDTHRNLLQVQQESPGEVYKELKTCLDKIEKYLALRPITLILPGGQMVENARYIRKNNLIWAVGISGGDTYDSTDFVIYVGREGPSGTAELTFRGMMMRFLSVGD
ncbi:MAG: hypothetical protein EHM70_02130 [Chloroflexota bacterium]|nr:MAG: hypothetical protein EHM70_02130 [Chloroflexota bacterium]